MPTTTLMSSSEVARVLGCTPRTVSRLVAADVLTPAAKGPGLRGAFLFNAGDIARLKRERDDRSKRREVAS
ncbi:helix-turn-helix domain-containing protein [Acidipropionibacterium timonense]|uniref:helix-turn-helix domain-containing protein n=1 Tax=Acidipropionibacterium timonense TaxID=2161818 RepID=UPI00103097D1|nr:helix-turn-helix domain-containing protein [Acidipropionibacterium timonense]